MTPSIRLLLQACMVGALLLLGGCSQSTTETNDATTLFTMTLTGAENGPHNFATNTMATLLTQDSTLIVVGSNTPFGSQIAKNNYALLEYRGAGVGTQPISPNDTTLTPANMMVVVDGTSYFAAEGSVSITAYRSVGQLVEGTFSATLIGENGGQLRVSNGRFAVKRVTDNSPYE
ncbi:MAG: hypothetical protein FGM24_05715 [Candidatus Kapabacteria bacterium]|nr:hypothetical protein [Candidatus Kapabacteria bacterium]